MIARETWALEYAAGESLSRPSNFRMWWLIDLPSCSSPLTRLDPSHVALRNGRYRLLHLGLVVILENSLLDRPSDDSKLDAGQDLVVGPGGR